MFFPCQTLCCYKSEVFRGGSSEPLRPEPGLRLAPGPVTGVRMWCRSQEKHDGDDKERRGRWVNHSKTRGTHTDPYSYRVGSVWCLHLNR